MRHRSSVFRQSLPVLITSLVNKSGTIGLSLLPMLLVEGNFSTAQSSLAMSFVKGSTIVASLASGWMSDVMGLRKTLLASFLLTAVGLMVLPIPLGLFVLIVSGVVAQHGVTATNTTMRLLLTRTVERVNQKEALGWMRSVNNIGQIFSYGLATMAAALGAKLLIWFDALTSLLAFLIGWKILPNERVTIETSSETTSGSTVNVLKRSRSWWAFIGCTLFLTGYNFMYEFFMAGVAGKLKVLFPVEGLRIFSVMMVVNTIFCAALAIVASRFLTRVVLSLIFAVLFTAGGLILGIHQTASIPLVCTSILFLTGGEIIYGAFGQFLLIRSVPASSRENTVYSGALLVANIGRMLAASLAFPLVVHASSSIAAVWLVVVVAIVSLLILVVGVRDFTQLAE